jgi:hypothetical protein
VAGRDPRLARQLDQACHAGHPPFGAAVANVAGKGVPVFALTNFGIESFAYAKTQYDFLSEFDRPYVSGHMRVIKPDPRIYEMVEEDCGLSGSSLLFADDRADNIEAARARGWHAHLFEGPARLGASVGRSWPFDGGGSKAMSVTIVAAEAEARLDWLALTRALEAGHERPRAEIGDTFLYRGGDTLLSRSAWIDGMGLLVKSATVFPGNAAHGAPSINGGVSLFSDSDGTLEAILDFHLVTKWKTAGDSLLAAMKLAPKDTRTILIVGAGTVAQSLREAYGAAFPDAVSDLEPVARIKRCALRRGFPILKSSMISPAGVSMGRCHHLRDDDDNAGHPR